MKVIWSDRALRSLAGIHRESRLTRKQMPIELSIASSREEISSPPFLFRAALFLIHDARVSAS